MTGRPEVHSPTAPLPGANAKTTGRVSGTPYEGQIGSGPAPSNAQDDVLGYLRIHCCGRANAIKQKHIAAAVGVSVRDLQDILKALTEEQGIPIASSCSPPYGVFLVEDAEEADKYIAQLRARALSCFRRISALNRAVASELVQEMGQQVLAFPGPSLRVGETVCGQCRKPFQPARSTQIYCSSECRFDAARARGSI